MIGFQGAPAWFSCASYFSRPSFQVMRPALGERLTTTSPGTSADRSAACFASFRLHGHGSKNRGPKLVGVENGTLVNGNDGKVD